MEWICVKCRRGAEVQAIPANGLCLACAAGTDIKDLRDTIDWELIQKAKGKRRAVNEAIRSGIRRS